VIGDGEAVTATWTEFWPIVRLTLFTRQRRKLRLPTVAGAVKVTVVPTLYVRLNGVVPLPWAVLSAGLAVTLTLFDTEPAPLADTAIVLVGVGVLVGVLVGGTGVFVGVGGTEVLVGVAGTGVFVGVSVGGTGVLVGVLVGGTGVFVAVGGAGVLVGLKGAAVFVGSDWPPPPPDITCAYASGTPKVHKFGLTY
jgi:hypothetical protein